MTRRAGAFTLLVLLTAAPGLALGGRVIDARTHTPVANAEVTIVGQRGSVRTASDGTFEWALPSLSSAVFVVIRQDGVVCRPIHVTIVNGTDTLTLRLDAAGAESVNVSGAAPAIDVSAGSARS